MKKLHIDLETFSSVDLKKYGMHKYVDSPDFEIMLFAYSFGPNEPIFVLDLVTNANNDRNTAKQLIQHYLTNPEWLKYAHNAPFEIACLEKYFGIYLPRTQWRCTAVMSAELGLPRALGQLTTAMRLPEERSKLGTGMALIRYFCCPCEPTKTNGQRTRNLPSHDPVRWAQFIEYCRMDVVAEMEVDRRLSFLPMPQSEWDLWVLDQEINDKGMRVDADFVQSAIAIGAARKEALIAEAVIITGLNKPTARGQLKEWLEEELDEELPDMKKGTIAKLLKRDDNDPMVERMLEIRQEVSKTSIAKYNALRGAMCADGRIRGTLMFYGASRTGRWAGRVFQPQNLPQNHLEDMEGAKWLVQYTDHHTVDMLMGSPSDVLSQLVRSAIIPKEGHKFIVADFSAVEARNLAWFADETWRLDVFKTHGMIYEASASAAFHIPMAQITKELRARGKVLELACGYGGSTGAVAAMDSKKVIPEADRKPIVDAWRKASPKIVQMWWDIGDAAIEAVVNPRRLVKTKYQGISFIHENGFLFLTLPSGRRLAYPRPRMRIDPKFGREQIAFEGVDQYTSKWGLIGTYGPKLVENICQAACRDLLGYGMHRVAEAGYDIILHVHDECIVEVPMHVTVEEIESLLALKPAWAETMPHKAAGFETLFYRKDD